MRPFVFIQPPNHFLLLLPEFGDVEIVSVWGITPAHLNDHRVEFPAFVVVEAPLSGGLPVASLHAVPSADEIILRRDALVAVRGAHDSDGALDRRAVAALEAYLA